MSAAIHRLFLDTSYTRTQTGAIGMTRTVRRLLDEFQHLAQLGHWSCHAAAIHTGGFREAASSSLTPLPLTPREVGGAARLFRWATDGATRKFALAALPVAVQHSAWRWFSRWTFDQLSAVEATVSFRTDDVLLMADASWHYEAWTAAQQARRQGARVALLVQDLIPLRHPEHCAPLVSRVFAQWLRQMLDCSDAVVCNSLTTEQDLRNYAASLNVSLPPTAHFRLGCDLLSGRSPGGDIRPSLNRFLEAQAPCFASVGSFEPRKNYAWLLEVFEHLWAEGRELRLLIAGRPTADCRALIERLMRHPQQGKRLLTLFDASDDEVEQLYARARALVLPSLAEGFGLPLVEARARGCPVIASDLPSFRELADAGVSLCSPNSIPQMEALVVAHATEDRRAVVGAMRHFGWRDSAQQCLGVLENLLHCRFEVSAES